MAWLDAATAAVVRAMTISQAALRQPSAASRTAGRSEWPILAHRGHRGPLGEPMAGDCSSAAAAAARQAWQRRLRRYWRRARRFSQGIKWHCWRSATLAVWLLLHVARVATGSGVEAPMARAGRHGRGSRRRLPGRSGTRGERGGGTGGTAAVVDGRMYWVHVHAPMPTSSMPITTHDINNIQTHHAR